MDDLDNDDDSSDNSLNKKLAAKTSVIPQKPNVENLLGTTIKTQHLHRLIKIIITTIQATKIKPKLVPLVSPQKRKLQTRNQNIFQYHNTCASTKINWTNNRNFKLKKLVRYLLQTFIIVLTNHSNQSKPCF
jgi:hypothetical protein